MRQARRLGRTMKCSAAPGLVGRLRPRLPILPWKDELTLVRAPGGHAPRAQIPSTRRKQPHRSVLARLGVSFLAERDRALNQDGPLPNVAPAQTEGFTGTKAGVGQNREERRIPRPERRAHRLNRRRRKRSHLLTTRESRLFHAPHRVVLDPTGGVRLLQHRAQEIQRLANSDRAGARSQAIRLPSTDRFRVDLP
jgi:hypothetical protein